MIMEDIWKKSDLKLGKDLAKGLTCRAGSGSKETSPRASKDKYQEEERKGCVQILAKPQGMVKRQDWTR